MTQKTLSQSAEKYLDGLLELTHSDELVRISLIAQHLGVTPSSATEMFQRLSEEGYVEYQRYYGVRFTETGYQTARRIRRRFLLLRRFLQDFLDLEDEFISEETRKFANIISTKIEQRLIQLLFPKKKDEGEEEIEELLSKSPSFHLIPLSELPPGQEGVIVAIILPLESKRELERLGLKTDKRIVTERGTSNSFQIDDQKISLSSSLTDLILVDKKINKSS
ncbi:MAG: DtxR family transcriptional regulator [Promethearchaeota archaeon]